MNKLQKILKQQIESGRKKSYIANEWGICRETLNTIIKTGEIEAFKVVKRIAEKSGISPNDLCG